MPKKIRLILTAILILFSVISFSSCDATEAKVLDATIQNTKASSYESETRVDWNIEISPVAKDQKLMVKRYLTFINSSYMTLKEKHLWEKDNIKGQGFAQMTLNTKIKNIETNMWIDTNLKEDSPKAKYIVQIPEGAKAGLSEELSSKDFAVLDLYNFISEEGADSDPLLNIDYEDLVQSIKTMDPLLKDRLLSLFIEYDYDGAEIEHVSTETFGEEEVNVYRVQLNQEEIEELIVYTLKFIEDKSQMSLEDDNLHKILTMLSQHKIGVFGEEGITIEFKVNNAGYIVRSSGDIHLALLLSEYIDVLPQSLKDITLSKLKGLSPDTLVDMKLQFTKDNTNFNGVSSITFPTLTDSNSFNFKELLSQ